MSLFRNNTTSNPVNICDTRLPHQETFANRDLQRMDRFCRILPTILLTNVFVALTIGFAWTLSAQESKPAAATKSSDKARKYVNKIPYDVFFDSPLQVVSDNKGSVSQPQNPAEKVSEKVAESKAAEKTATSSVKSGDVPWDELIPIDELQSEVKTVRNSLTKLIANQGQFNQNYLLIAVDGAELAALAGIAQQHAESTTWKEKAHYVREFGAQLNQSAIGLGKENFEKTKSVYQKLTSVFDGSIPADAGNIPSNRPFHETASRKGLMRRIERAKDWLKQDVNSEAKFKSMADQIVHESTVISALTTIITKTGYDYTEDDAYQGFAKTLIDGAKEASAAVKDESYEKFKLAIDKVNKSCTDCHGTYGNQ